jgi:CRP/FNR family nitrogen fixation transcriptional regulator
MNLAKMRIVEMRNPQAAHAAAALIANCRTDLGRAQLRTLAIRGFSEFQQRQSCAMLCALSGASLNRSAAMTTGTSSTLSNGTIQYRKLLTHQPHPLKRLDQLAVIRPCRRGQEICSQGRPADYWYCVMSGAARRYVIRLDGRRQIVDLLLPGDAFGFTSGEECDCTTEAIAEGTVVAAYPRKRVETLADSDPELAREIRQIVLHALTRLQAQLLIVGRITASEKIGSFILEMATRLSGEQGNTVALPMSRYDIADYLAVSVETVSRALSDLKHRGVIKLSGARIVRIIDRDALEDGERRALASQDL